MSYADAVALVEQEEFRQRVHAAVLAAAIGVMNEARDAEHAEYFDKREDFAKRMIQNFGMGYESFVWAVAVNPTVSSAGLSAPDNDIDYVVASVFDALAGISSDEKPSG